MAVHFANRPALPKCLWGSAQSVLTSVANFSSIGRHIM